MRIASLSPAVTEILCALGVERQIVCTDQYSDYPASVRHIPHLKDHQKIDVSMVLEFQPDIVFTSTLLQHSLADALRLYSHDFAVVHQDPRSLQGVYDTIREIGTYLGCDDRAHSLCENMRSELAVMKRRAGLLSRKPKMYIEEWHHPPMVAGNWVPDLVRLAGGIPFPLAANEVSREISLTEVEQFSPDAIILSICGAGHTAQKHLFTDRPGWNKLPAALSGKIYIIDDSFLNRPGPRLVEGARRLYGWIFQAAHL